MSPNDPVDPVVAASRAVLAEHARTFNLAGAFLPADRLDEAAVIYAFCRLVDDTVDEAPSAEVGIRGIAQIEAELRRERPPRPLLVGLLEIAERRRIDLRVFEELIVGVRSDSEEVRIADDGDLLRYCYRVAGTVGLMMCGAIGVESRFALPFALDLGLGMQITNICRDVAEDAERGRIYIPESRLRRVGLDPATILNGTVDRRLLSVVIEDLLELAERYYESADHGMSFIPARSRVAILIASRVYRAIGRRLMAHGSDPMIGRTIVPPRSKARWLSAALLTFATRRGLESPVPHDPWLHRELAGFPGADPLAAELAPRFVADPRSAASP